MIDNVSVTFVSCLNIIQNPIFSDEVNPSHLEELGDDQDVLLLEEWVGNPEPETQNKVERVTNDDTEGKDGADQRGSDD